MSGAPPNSDVAGTPPPSPRRPVDGFDPLAKLPNGVAWTWSPGEGLASVVQAQLWWAEVTGQPLEEQNRDGVGWLEMVHPDDRETVASVWPRVFTQNVPCDIEYRFRSRAGGWRYVHSRAVPIRGPGGVVLEWVGCLTDVTDARQVVLERERLHRAVEAERQKLAEAFQHAPSIMCVLRGPDHVFERVNDRHFELHGRRDVIGRSVREALPELEGQGFFEILDRVYATGRPYTGTQARVWLRRGGKLEERVLDFVYQPLWDADGTVTGILAQSVDLTDRVRAEEGLRQAAKMEAVGQLAGGVAHDFNNLLTVINGYALLLLRELAPTHPGAEMAAEVLAAGKRAEDLIRRLLAFGRRQVLQPRELDLNELIANLTKMLHRLIGEDVRITTALSPSLGRVIADPAQLEQVIINLCVNARDVMPAGGRLTIATAPVKVVADSPLAQKQFPLGRYARISVTDTGCGMSEAVLEKIFEPFFTTKPVGRGTGLGLSTAFGIVTQSGGRIEVASTVGEGTTFDVYLPVVTGGSGVVAAASERVGPAVGGHETVLLVEDESVVRQFTATVLRNAGYTVLEAEGAAEATRTHAAHAGAVRLLLTDVVMPHESGCTLAERLRRASPGLRVLFMSGFADDRTVGHGLQKTEAKFVQKPFDADELLRAVRRVLDLPDAT